jgi:hypothetical protein
LKNYLIEQKAEKRGAMSSRKLLQHILGLTFVVWWLIGCSHDAPAAPPPTSTLGPAKATPAALLLTVSPVNETSQPETNQPTPPPVATTEIQATTQPDAEIRLEETAQLEDDAEAIRAALIEKTGIGADKLEFAVAQNSGLHARGTLKHKDDPGGAYFIAAKVDDRWVIVYDGQATPACTAIAPYEFPVDMVPECLDGNNNLVVRGVPMKEAEAGLMIVGTVMNVSLSARIITLQEPVESISVIALTEESELASSDGEEITLQDIQPGMTIQASGEPGDSGALLARQVRLLP